MANANHRAPRPLSEILGELFALRGYGRLRALSELEKVWNTAVGEPDSRQTRLGELRRGILNVSVGHPTLLEELVVFRKPALLQALRRSNTGTTIHDIRFHVALIEELDPRTVDSVSMPRSTISAPRHSHIYPEAPSKQSNSPAGAITPSELWAKTKSCRATV